MMNEKLILFSSILIIYCTWFVICVVSLRIISRKKIKEERDIRNRRRLINNITVSSVIILTTTPFVIDCCGIDLFGTQQDVYGLIESGMMIVLFLTTLVFLSDNIIRRLATPIYVYSEIKDLENFCLYLRPFNLDSGKDEKSICKVAHWIYPVYAVGNPNVVLDPNGAERIYLSDAMWKTAVKELASRSTLVMIRVGQSEGCMWEMSYLIDSNLIDKTVFLVYNHDDYIFLKDIIHLKLSYEIPDIEKSHDTAFAIYFDPECDKFIKCKISNRNDVRELFNSFLCCHRELDEVYAKDMALRTCNVKYMFNHDYIPGCIRRSLNWGVISPIANMRHWPVLLVCIFFALAAFSVFYRTVVPIIVFEILSLLYGNRLEWAAGSWSSARLFLQKQHRIAAIQWSSCALALIYAAISWCI